MNSDSTPISFIERLSLRFKRFLALLQSSHQNWQKLLQHIILAARDDELGLRGFTHDLDPILVNLLELLGFLGEFGIGIKKLWNKKIEG
jgi:hypothetical protein